MAFNLTVEMGGLVIFDPDGERMLAMDHRSHRLYLFFKPYQLDEDNSSLPTKLQTDYQGNRFLKLKKNWQVVFPASDTVPSQPGDDRGWQHALPISELGLTGLKPNPALCGDLILPKNKSAKGTLGQLPDAYHFPATTKEICGIGDKLFWRAQYSGSWVDLAVMNRGDNPVGTLRVTTRGTEAFVDAACVPGAGGNPFDEHKGLEQAATGTYLPPRSTKSLFKHMHVGSGSCPPVRR